MRTGLKDLLLPIAVVAVVGMMIFPLPPVALDFLLMLNISFALVLLVNSVYLAEPEKFTALPSILLLSTLFRLGLNISTTRQILATGHAPDVVSTFGNFVVGGNLVVGVVVFAIITLVQFLVIAKGAERVAEVAARFTLDAMPGKQMSIDADVRAGVINLNEARERRADLHRESKLFGALDGAMKFVKGDAVAGLVITLINILGGLFVGVEQQGLSLVAALAKYTVFTVGDGLASQIPALLVSVAAGIAVTRVGDKTNSYIGRDVLTQLVREPQALGTAAAVLLGLAAVPGLPAIPFLGMATVVGVTASRLKTRLRHQAHKAENSKFSPKLYSPLLLRLGSESAIALKREQRLPKLYQELRVRLFERHGVLVSDLQFEIGAELAADEFEFRIHGVSFERQLCAVTADVSAIVNAVIEQVLAKHLAELIDDTQTRMLLELHQPLACDLINNLVPAQLSVTALTLILRALVSDGVSVRELGKILQAIAEYFTESELSESARGAKGNSGSMNQNALTEVVAKIRIALRRNISQAVGATDKELGVYVLAAELDHLLARLARSGTALNPILNSALVERLQSLQSADSRLVIVCTTHARSLLQELVRIDGIAALVVAAEELVEELQLKVLGEISLPGLQGRTAAEMRDVEAA